MVLLGRSPECQITIEDPLVSRQHARIRIEGDEAQVEDLGSRNGVRVNGRPIEGSQVLKHSDRIRLGTQELVFLAVANKRRSARTTGFMSVCPDCGTPYPEQAKRCPHCGSSEPPQDEDTISGLVVEPKRSWTFQLLGEVIERALSTGRAIEADRLLRRAAHEVDERLQAGARLDVDQLATMSGYAIDLAALRGDREWIDWALGLHRSQHRLPDDAVLSRLEGLGRGAVPALTEALGKLVEWARGQEHLEGPDDALERLEQLAGSA